MPPRKSQSLHHDHERATGRPVVPCVATTELAAVRAWGDGVRCSQRNAWAVEVGVGRSAAGAEWRQLYTVAREPSWHGSEAGRLARWWTGRPVGVGGLGLPSQPQRQRQQEHQLPRSLGSARLGYRRSGVLLILRLGKAAMDGRSATLATARPRRGRALAPS